MMRHLAWAAAAFLAACASPGTNENVRPSPPLQLAPIRAGAPFREEILQFAEADRANPPPHCPVLFVGSSSIRQWTSLARDMAPLPVLNRGFGGSTISDVNRYFDHLITPYRPRAIVFYAGENDIDAGQAPAAVAEHFRRFVDAKRARLGDVPVFYISAKPSKLRFAQLARQSALNAAVRALARTSRDLVYVDVASAMIDRGRPLDLYVADGLHMAPAGYAIWRDRVRQALVASRIPERRCRD